MNYHDVVAYVREITPESDPDEVLSFAAQVAEDDPLLMTVPILFFAHRGGNVTGLMKAAARRKRAAANDSLHDMLATLRGCISCEERGGDEFRTTFFTLAEQVAEDLGDEDLAEDFRIAEGRCR